MVDVNPGRTLIPKIIDTVVDMVVAEYPDHGEIRLAIYEQIGENLLAMARVLRGNPHSIIERIQAELENDEAASLGSYVVPGDRQPEW